MKIYKNADTENDGCGQEDETMMKNIPFSQVLTLREQIAYQPGQVVSRTLVQNESVSVTLFSFDKDEEISTHESGGDAFVTCLRAVHQHGAGGI